MDTIKLLSTSPNFCRASFLEAQFQEILEAMKTDKISVLEDYKEFFEMIAQKTGYYHNKDGYYEALASISKI